VPSHPDRVPAVPGGNTYSRGANQVPQVRVRDSLARQADAVPSHPDGLPRLRYPTDRFARRAHAVSDQRHFLSAEGDPMSRGTDGMSALQSADGLASTAHELSSLLPTNRVAGHFDEVPADTHEVSELRRKRGRTSYGFPHGANPVSAHQDKVPAVQLPAARNRHASARPRRWPDERNAFGRHGPRTKSDSEHQHASAGRNPVITVMVSWCPGATLCPCWAWLAR
jgi:hypothetical protein